MTRHEERRADRWLAARIGLEQRAAAAEEARQKRAERAEQARAARQAASVRRSRRAAAVARLRAWAAANVVDLLIYPAVLVAFAMSAPSMGSYGQTVYGSRLGALLPGISELLMLAFAAAVQVSRRRTPARPVWALQAGMILFAANSAALNFMHGLARGWDAGMVMAVVAVSGIVAHQFTIASPPRSRAERADARVARYAARQLGRVRRAAVRQAVVEIGADGSARLVYAPGRYTLTRRGRLEEQAPVPGRPVVSVDPTADWDAELAALTDPDSEPEPVDPEPVDPSLTEPSAPTGRGSTTTLDRRSDLDGSTPDRPNTGRPPKRSRSLEQLAAELSAAVDAGEVDPTSAESIRRGLRCGIERARTLRDDYQGDRGRR